MHEFEDGKHWNNAGDYLSIQSFINLSIHPEDGIFMWQMCNSSSILHFYFFLAYSISFSFVPPNDTGESRSNLTHLSRAKSLFFVLHVYSSVGQS